MAHQLNHRWLGPFFPLPKKVFWVPIATKWEWFGLDGKAQGGCSPCFWGIFGDIGRRLFVCKVFPPKNSCCVHSLKIIKQQLNTKWYHRGIIKEVSCLACSSPCWLLASQEARYLISTFLTWLMASIGLSVIILMGLDGIQMQGA